MLKIVSWLFLVWYSFVSQVRAKFRNIRADIEASAGMNVGSWIYIIIMFVVLFAVLVALYGTLYSGASNFGNQTGAIGKVVVTLLPILLAVSVLLLFVTHFLPKGSGGGVGGGGGGRRHKK